MAEKAGDDQWLAVARVLRPRGRKGEVTAEVLTDFPERFAAMRRVYVEASGGQPEPAEIAASWWHQGTLILHFAGVDSIREAERLRGLMVMIPREERAQLGRNQYYVWELVGCAVVRQGGDPVGTVIGVEPTGGVDLLRVRGQGVSRSAQDVLIPLAEEICTRIDVIARRIVIEPPEGLLDLNGS
ncbi:MAG TPA: ribosome maturation factor RimM [Terriglobia bacterium]|nr:ribosome maturation factor RimM [Terriglobia bacterium]